MGVPSLYAVPTTSSRSDDERRRHGWHRPGTTDPLAARGARSVTLRLPDPGAGSRGGPGPAPGPPHLAGGHRNEPARRRARRLDVAGGGARRPGRGVDALRGLGPGRGAAGRRHRHHPHRRDGLRPRRARHRLQRRPRRHHGDAAGCRLPRFHRDRREGVGRDLHRQLHRHPVGAGDARPAAGRAVLRAGHPRDLPEAVASAIDGPGIDVRSRGRARRWSSPARDPPR